MLNPFPTLLYLERFAPMILRIVLGLVFLLLAYQKITKERSKHSEFFESLKLYPGGFFVWIFAILEIVSGLFMLAGFLTQIAAVVFITISVLTIIAKLIKRDSTQSEILVYILLLTISISLLFFGAGIYAVDIPL
ncbi:MAG: DoxX family protein [Candidatus Paceibacterota bacterium]